MNVVDSSAWIEYLRSGPNADEFAPAIESPDDLIVPSLTVYEIYKRTAQLAGEDAALIATGLMLKGVVVDLTATLAIDAARASTEYGLAMADAIILATARAHSATMWTQDRHFEGLPNVEFRPSR